MMPKTRRRVRTEDLLTGHNRYCLTLAGFGDILVTRGCRFLHDKENSHFVRTTVVPRPSFLD